LFLDHEAAGARKIDLGEEWTAMTGLPFVYACWTGWPEALTREDVDALRRARDAGVAQSDAVAAAYFPEDTARQAIARRYLRDNIQYSLGPEELEGLTTFYRYTSEMGLSDFDGTLQFYDADDQGSR
jgi:chorismate dehydratase